MSTVPILVKAECRVCGKFRDPREFVHDEVVGFCWTCYENHLIAMRLLCQGTVPPGCQECGAPSASLEAPNGDVKMYLHPKDGIYQVLCRRCSDHYEHKQSRLYVHTPYGAARKLSGNR